MRSPSTLFREEAVEFHLRGNRTQGDLLRLSPRWTTWTYWLLVVVFVTSAIYLVFGRINDYATGVAIIRDEGRTMVTARSGGTVTVIAVQAGQHVETNQELLRFNDVQEMIELDQLRQEFHAQHIHWLTNPHDPAAQQQLAATRARLETAEKRLKERTVFAPCAGMIRDLRLRPHQLVAAGELLLTIVGDQDVLSVMAILPGPYRPFLTPGKPLRLELTGFRYAYQRMTIDAVGNEVVGPNEVRRFLGPEVSDAVPLQGSLVIVQAQLPSRTFYAEGRWHAYHDGMHGTAEVRVRSERMVLALLPGLQAAFRSKHDEDTRLTSVR